jgi:hypothetical protein
MNNTCLDDITIIKSWITPGAGNAIIIDGIYHKYHL